MISKRILPLFLILISIVEIQAQGKDTLKIMAYNLLYYRQITSFCTATNNNTTTKESAMEDIIDHVLPDILVVNEMGGGSAVKAFRLATNSLNTNGRSNYSFASSTGLTQSLVNMLYFNKDKLVLESQSTVSRDLNNNNLVRLIDIYTLRYKDTNLAVHKDTTRIHIVAAHLKAGSSTANKNERADATEALMAHLDTINASGNYIFAGDLNLSGSTEGAYQDLVNYVDTNLRFYDPINISGNWNQLRYSLHHTQSTRTSGGCAASGGLDDRFDLMLFSDEIRDSTDHVKYIPNSYQALGQDGSRYNGRINSPANTSVSTTVANALNDMSDHLPVLMDLEVTLPIVTSNSQKLTQHGNKLRFQNPTNGDLVLDLRLVDEELVQIEILDLTGKTLDNIQLRGQKEIHRNLHHLPKGTYFIRGTYKTYQQFVKKLIKI